MNICQQNKRIKLDIKDISKSFDGLLTLNNITLNVKENEFVSIVGPSGSGKTTLFNIIAGLLRPEHGTVCIDGENYNGRTGRVSYMYQKDLLLPWKKIIDNVSLPLIIKGESKKNAHAQVMPYFKTFGLEGFEYKYPFQLSGGMKQRAALMRTYMHSSDIILLDEPFGSLDAITRRKMQYWLLEVIHNLKASILMITHDIEEAIFLSDRVYVMDERPSKIKAEFLVDLPGERTLDTITSVKFIDLKKQILNIL